MKKIILICILGMLYSCSEKDTGIRKGVFLLYEQDSMVGKIYRSGNYQIESYADKQDELIRIDHISPSGFLLKGKSDLDLENSEDSLIASVTYEKIGADRYKIKIRLVNESSSYRYYAEYLKISEEIPEKYKRTLDSLNKK